MAMDKKHHLAGMGQGGRVLVVVERRRPAQKWSMPNGMDEHKTSRLTFGSTNCDLQTSTAATSFTRV